MTSAKLVCVVIPFYQRETGILRRAVQSIYDQHLAPDIAIRVIVIDDGSPVDAAAELSGFAPPSAAVELVCVRQANGGCGAARNAALKLVPAECDYIAFLDSDDIWASDHLATAVAALSAGFDFYFSDHSRDDFYPSYFDQTGFPGALSTVPLTVLGHEVREVPRADFFEFFLRRYVPQISTVVYRRAIAPDASFSSQLKFASEDYLFLLSLVQVSERVCYGASDAARCGSGVNVYYSTFSWADEGHLRRHMGDLLGAYALRSELELNDDGRALIDKRVRELRETNAFFLVRWTLKGHFRWSEDLRQLVRADPDFWTWFPAAIPGVISRQLMGRGPGSTMESRP